MGPILGGIKQYKCMVILMDFPYNALFGLVSYKDPCWMVLASMIFCSGLMTSMVPMVPCSWVFFDIELKSFSCEKLQGLDVWLKHWSGTWRHWHSCWRLMSFSKIFVQFHGPASLDMHMLLVLFWVLSGWWGISPKAVEEFNSCIFPKSLGEQWGYWFFRRSNMVP